MSKISQTLLCIVIGAIVVGMYFEVPELSNGVGALLVFGLVYSFVVAKREVALMAVALDQKTQAADVRFAENVIVPEWLNAPDSEMPSEPQRRRKAAS